MLTVADLIASLQGVPADLPVQIHVEMELDQVDDVPLVDVDEWAHAFRAERASVPGEGPAFVLSM